MKYSIGEIYNTVIETTPIGLLHLHLFDKTTNVTK